MSLAPAVQYRSHVSLYVRFKGAAGCAWRAGCAVAPGSSHPHFAAQTFASTLSSLHPTPPTGCALLRYAAGLGSWPTSWWMLPAGPTPWRRRRRRAGRRGDLPTGNERGLARLAGRGRHRAACRAQHGAGALPPAPQSRLTKYCCSLSAPPRFALLPLLLSHMCLLPSNAF